MSQIAPVSLESAIEATASVWGSLTLSPLITPANYSFQKIWDGMLAARLYMRLLVNPMFLKKSYDSVVQPIDLPVRGCKL